MIFVSLFLVVSTSAIDCLKRLVSKITCYVSSGTINPTPSPGWGPRGQDPSKNYQGPGKNNWIVHVKKIEKYQMPTLCSMEAGADG